MTPLNKITILNTRPTQQAEALNKALQSLGAQTLNFPTLIIDSINETQTKQLCQQLSGMDIAIFLSANAVQYSQAYWPTPFPIPTIIAIGPSTAKTIKQHHVTPVITPEQYNSEGLLALPVLSTVMHKKIIIFCGKDPRPLLHKMLNEGGADIRLCECYQRLCPNNGDALTTLLHDKKIDVIISTSQDSLNNLNTLINDNEAVKKIPLVVISSGMETLAKRQGWRHTILASDASNQAIAEALIPLIPQDARF